MKALVAVMAIAVFTLAISRAAIALGDRTLFVPPPEAVCEDFLRKMAEHRYAQAKGDLASTLNEDERDLEAIQASVEASYGRVEHVQGEASQIVDGREGTARSSVRFGDGPRDVILPLRFENGLWKISSVDPLRPRTLH